MASSFPRNYNVLGTRAESADLVSGPLEFDERLRSGIFAAYHKLVSACGTNPYELSRSLDCVCESADLIVGELSKSVFKTTYLVGHYMQFLRPQPMSPTRPLFGDSSQDVVVHTLCYVPSWDEKGFTEPGIVVYATPGTHRSLLLAFASPLETALNDESHRITVARHKNLLRESASFRHNGSR